MAATNGEARDSTIPVLIGTGEPCHSSNLKPATMITSSNLKNRHTNRHQGTTEGKHLLNLFLQSNTFMIQLVRFDYITLIRHQEQASGEQNNQDSKPTPTAAHEERSRGRLRTTRDETKNSPLLPSTLVDNVRARTINTLKLVTVVRSCHCHCSSSRVVPRKDS